ncbi:S-adenosylmethionine-dependent methyltransferase [Aspergillus ruber CBS 135680]|uniref:Methyltransferase-domain-containing protein n=1 Tax=Aspergillus ruber (strain CBS 135680) TaxID=1388766 RepID=A0A017SFY5_ASPRC|nr:uncharacterized protein EURHEDRAFT_411937 [Aspergillus ruber CBS 135680]EYE95656.1 hypothetical protein EURHEDRAFT_411937 [Aspergillus ruber CBS 135680]
MNEFLSSLGHPVEDTEEESFLLFAQEIPTSNLGFVDSRAHSLEVTIHGNEYTIQQSPSLLSSSRAGGTTGAVLWKITPLFAEWISGLTSNPLWTHLDSPLQPAVGKTVVELGCGIAGLVALSLGPLVQHYVATDQEYVHRLLRENLEENKSIVYKQKSGGSKGKSGKKKGASKQAQSDESNISFTSLDWELDAPDLLKKSVGIASENDDEEDNGFDLLLSCDCIYNEALIVPFVRTCADICRLRPAYHPEKAADERGKNPTICIIAQKQRTPDVFEAWLEETLKIFWVWRLSDEILGERLKGGTGYMLHLLVLRDDA